MSRCLPAIAAFLALLVCAGAARAQALLPDFLDALTVSAIFPGADRLGPVEGTPPAAAAYRGDQLVGYVFLNSDVVNTTGYSGKPIHVAVAMDLEGTIVGADLLAHSEPIVLIGIPERKIKAYIAGYIGYNVLHKPVAPEWREPDVVSGATVTVLVIGDTIARAAVRVARARGIGGAAPAEAAPARAIDPARMEERDWETLLGDGSVRRLHLTIGQVNEAFARTGDERAAARPEPGEPEDTFIDLYVAQVSVPSIGRSLLGEHEWRNLRSRLGEGESAVLVMGRGDYSWRGSGYVRGGIFDRIELDQGDETVRFRDRNYSRIGDVEAAGAPNFPEIGLFTLPEGASFEPAAPWRLQLLVQRAVGALEKRFLTFEVSYQVPEDYLLPAAPPPAAETATAAAPVAAQDLGEAEEPLWVRVWRRSLPQIGVLAAALGLLTVVFYFQDWLVKRPSLTYWARTGFLAFTLLWLGWVANAQLSVVNVLTLTNSLITGFSWDYFLMDPLLFILWAGVAASLILWGRGVFCGWLCPFGALQEFLNRAARRLRIPQIAVPWGVHERLWTLKYVIFIGLFGVALYQLAFAERLAEVEPFKTAIILKFIRDWPFVVYAVLLLAAGLFVERFFCRYLCPLGAALAIPARLRTMEWLKRHRECGSPCQRCANECPVQSIHPLGQINPNECIYCMHCQTLYWDEHRCPHMVQVRLRRERRAAMGAPPPAGTPPTDRNPERGASAFDPVEWSKQGGSDHGQ